jgi:hypothetical protein
MQHPTTQAVEYARALREVKEYKSQMSKSGADRRLMASVSKNLRQQDQAASELKKAQYSKFINYDSTKGVGKRMAQAYGVSTSRALPSYLKKKNLAESRKVSLGVAGMFGYQNPAELAGGDTMTASYQTLMGGGAYPSGGTGRSAGRGRGRPVQSFTPKMLPDGTVVRMPVQAYKRAVSAQKAQYRLQQAMAQARLEAQPSPQEMPRGTGYGAEDQFNYQQQPQYPQQQMQQQGYPQQMQQQPQQQSMGQRLMAGLTRFGNSLMPGQAQASSYPQQSSQFQGQMVQAPPMSAGTYPTRRISLWGTGVGIPKEQNILNTPNVFNRPNDARLIR